MSEVGLRCGSVLVEGPFCEILRKVWEYASSDFVGSMGVYLTVKLCSRKKVWEYTVTLRPSPCAVRVLGSGASVQAEVRQFKQMLYPWDSLAVRKQWWSVCCSSCRGCVGV